MPPIATQDRQQTFFIEGRKMILNEEYETHVEFDNRGYIVISQPKCGDEASVYLSLSQAAKIGHLISAGYKNANNKE